MKLNELLHEGLRIEPGAGSINVTVNIITDISSALLTRPREDKQVAQGYQAYRR